MEVGQCKVLGLGGSGLGGPRVIRAPFQSGTTSGCVRVEGTSPQICITELLRGHGHGLVEGCSSAGSETEALRSVCLNVRLSGHQPKTGECTGLDQAIGPQGVGPADIKQSKEISGETRV